MKHFNFNPLLFGLTLFTITVLTQSCKSDVGENEDNTKPSVVLTSLNDGKEVIGDFAITWETNEPNKSTVDIHLSYGQGENGNYIYNTSDAIALNTPDTGFFEWKSNDPVLFKDCRTCRIKITPTDIVGNVGKPAESENDFIINNIPQVLGTAFYTDTGNDGFGNDDTIRVPFDKDVKLLTAIASDIFIFPVPGDSIGPFATVSKGKKDNELIITFNNIIDSEYHLHISKTFDPKNLKQTAPSGMNILNNLAEGILFSDDTERTAQPNNNGIDISSTFSLSQEFGSDILNMALGDVNNDGHLDMVGNYTFDGIRIALNDGSGAFIAPGQPLVNETGTIIQSTFIPLALGDIDNDGDLDLVTSSLIWLNDGNGTFTHSGLPQHKPTINDLSVVLGDIDKDGDLDLLANNEVLLNNKFELEEQKGFFTSNQLLGNFSKSTSVLEDINNDGYLDVVLGSGGGDFSNSTVTVWLNNDPGNPGKGTFTELTQTVNNITGNTVLGDIDNDGDSDLITDGRKIWFNDGSGTFIEDLSQSLENPAVRATALVDFDEDGDLDLIVGIEDEYANPNNIWINDSKGTFEESELELNVGITYELAVGDIDNDGDKDLLFGNLFKAAEIWKNSLRMPGKIFIDSNQSLGIGSTESIVLGDIDGDGDLDFIDGASFPRDSSNSHRGIIWLNDGKGNFLDSGETVGFDGGTTTDTRDDDRIVALSALKDLDGNGSLDIIAGFNSANNIYLNDGNGKFTKSTQIIPVENENTIIKLGDIDGDTDVDIVVGNSTIANTIWLNDDPGNPGKGTFTESTQAIGTGSVTIGDIDGDEDIDILVANDDGNSIWLNNDPGNPGKGNFTKSNQEIGNKFALLVDIDSDEDLDIVSNTIWLNIDPDNPLNSGKGKFIDTGKTIPSFNPRSVFKDIDNDGDVDILDGNSVILNHGNGIFNNSGQLIRNDDNDANTSFDAGDLDNDGDDDLIIGHQGIFSGSGNSVWLNDF